MQTPSPSRLAATASLTLASALVLAACGGGDDDSSQIAPSPDDTPAPAETSEPAEEEPDDSSESSEPAEEGPSQDASDAPTDEPADDPTDEPTDDPAGAPGGVPQVEVAWPEDWTDLSSDLGGSVPPTYDLQAYGIPNPAGFSTNVVVVAYPPGTATGGSYDEMVEAQGLAPDELRAVPDREIGGHPATGYSTDASGGGLTYRQQMHGVVLEDGSAVEVVYSADVEEFDEHVGTFEAILDSIVIGG
ncbi:hypothetical protein [Georgenia sp. Z1491]|uniref:hypothetical protein n=1 Tax=Georgenia sp. Z1491 TaxID=3416707 RepID=UPI003CEE89F5